MADVVSSLGAVGVGLMVAAENIFPPIPSEVVLPVAGYVASQGRMSLAWTIVAATLGSLVGAWLLYGLGERVGVDRLRRLFDRMWLVDASDLDRAVDWFERHGGAAVLIGRCVPVVRSLVSVPAGVARMPLWKFTLFTLVGSTVWNAGLVLGGYVLGSQFTEIGRYSDYINWAVYALIAYLVVRFVVRRRSRRADHPQP
ncbi:MAG TPA: DedA family protein [Actinomycetales bacterium]|nr:DedA family protein [Actinomycetales bacterium]